jgi:hypothetical protein
MASIPLAESALASLKKLLRTEYPDVKSSHLSEAIAAALGRKSHAALLADLSKQQISPDYDLLDDEDFDKRLQEFGYPPDPEFSFEWLDKSVPELISTVPPSAFDIAYRTESERAWRNLMVCAINEGLRLKLFTLQPDNYNWASQENAHHRRDGRIFDFVLSNGLPARGYVGDAGFGELSIHAAVNPNGDWVKASNAGFEAGDAFAGGWLEREKGAWLQSATTRFNCRKPLLKSLANIEVRPRGFGDRGRVIM